MYFYGALPPLLLAFVATGVQSLSLNVTAIAATNNASTLECWQMDTPFSISTTSGTAGSASLGLGDV